MIANQTGVMSKAKGVVLAVGLGGIQAVAHQLAGAQQHQAVNQFGLALAGSAEVAANERALAGVVQVVGNIGRVTWGNGDQRIKRSTPGIHGVRDQVDFFDRALRLIGHCGVPRCCCYWSG